MEEELKTPKEMAEKLRVSISWIYMRTRERGPDAIPTLRVGRYLRFEPHKVRAWLEQKQK